MFRTINNITGWLVFLITAIVYYFSAEPTGSLWDCGEFVSGAYKLQVVHPPGAPLFLIIGRLFAWFGSIVSSKPETIAFSVNMLSGICTALGAMFVCWTTVIFGKLALVGREGEPNQSQTIALAFSGLVAGLAMAFSTSIWFSAVEGEVYAMSTFFTCLTIWSIIKWYNLPDDPSADRWILFSIYAAGLSIGVHLLSLLTFPALALFYYFKKYKEHTIKGVLIAGAVGVAIIMATQKLVITGIPTLWYYCERITVNGFGLPVFSGLFPTLAILLGGIWWGLRYAQRNGDGLVQRIILGYALAAIGFSTIGMVVIRANANPPINMNNPDNPMSLLPYINREQYGERPLLRGPHFDAKPTGTDQEERLGRVGDHYEVTGRKIDYTFADEDKMLFPRIGHYEQGRPQQHRLWMDGRTGVPTMGDNLSFFFRYQLNWMYWRYFMWNFVGRQNGDQGYYPWDKTTGHWLSGVSSLDGSRLYNQEKLPPAMKNNQARNTYYFLPLIFGLLGIFFQFSKRRKDFVGLAALFIITGIGIIIYSNQPPNEPRERDYVLVGSFLTFCMWIGMGVLAVYQLLSEKLKLNGMIGAPIAGLLALSAPLIMGFQNFDDHSRSTHYASRDYASNFLNSVDKNAIIFTYGDNDTYPLWYAQEVEGIRTDVRVVNLSLIAVDWYINQMRRKVNESPAIKMTIPEDGYRGFKRDQVPVYSPGGSPREMNLKDAVKFIGENHPVSAGGGMSFESYLPTTNLYMDVDINKVKSLGIVGANDSIVSRINMVLGEKSSLLKDDLAVMDIVASNAFDRPIYWAVTCQSNKLLGLQDYLRLEGLALRLVPVKSTGDNSFGIIGSGSVDLQRTHDDFLNKFKCGGFDNHRTFVDRSYLPSVQSHKLVLARSVSDAIKKGEKKIAVDLLDKYFAAFPNENFPYDFNALFMIMSYLEADAYDKAKPQMQILAKETEDYLNFCQSLDQSDLKAGFEQDYMMSMRNKDELVRIAERAKDDAFAKELKDRFAKFGSTNMKN